MELFVYGTLMDDRVVASLTGQHLRKEPAALRGYRRVLPAVGYPYIMTDAQGVVDGFVLHNVGAEALRAFDKYEDEGRLYRRTEVVINVAGREEPAWTYVGVLASDP
jgi:gamma-glutamylcyclotransferase (GGCT)/AIG2-like uncharacterized protein YtfP